MDSKFPELSFEHALRYLFPGASIYFEIWKSDPALIHQWDAFDKIAFMIVVGTGLYSVYRAVIYDYVIQPTSDYISRKLQIPTYRNWIMNQHNVVTSAQADELYSGIRSNFPALNTPEMRQRSALIHFMYLTSFIFLISPLIFFLAGLSQPTTVISSLLIATLFLLSAAAADFKIDKQILCILKQPQGMTNSPPESTATRTS